MDNIETALKMEKNFHLSWSNLEMRKAISSRIRECAAAVGSGDALAAATGIPRRTLENYLSGNSEPKVSAISLIAEAAGKSLDWLILGKEHIRHQVAEEQVAYKRIEPINVELLTGILLAIDAELKKKGIEIEPEKQAKLVTLLYKLHSEADDKEVDMTNVIRLVDLIQ